MEWWNMLAGISLVVAPKSVIHQHLFVFFLLETLPRPDPSYISSTQHPLHCVMYPLYVYVEDLRLNCAVNGTQVLAL